MAVLAIVVAAVAVLALTAGPERSPDAKPRLGTAPRTCRSGPPPRPAVVAPAYGRLIGAAPVWAGVYARFDSAARAYRLRDAPRTRLGWRVKILWLLEPGQATAARVTGKRLASARRVSFQLAGRAPAAAAVLDPAAPGVSETDPDAYREYPSYAYFPRAGCYELVARWSERTWRLVFGVGR